jgi:hypothetical protein
MTEELPRPSQLLAAIRNHCDKQGYKGKQRAEVIQEYKRLVMERTGVIL